MAGMEEQLPLNDELAPGTEPLPDDPRWQAPRTRLVFAIAATLALACTASVTWQKKRSVVQVPSGDLSTQRVFLAEVAANDEGSAEADSAVEVPDQEPDQEPDKKKKGTAKDAAKDAAKAKADAAAAAKALLDAAHLNSKASDFKERADDLKAKAKDTKADSENLGKDVAETRDQASKGREAAEEARTQAKESRSKAEKLLKDTEQGSKDVQAEAEKKAAEILEKAMKKAKDMTEDANKKASDLGTQAQDLDSKAVGLDEDAKKKDGSADTDQSRAEALASKAHKMQGQSVEARQNAIDTEQQARHEVAAQRMCIGLPGVKLQGNSPAAFDAVVGKHEIADDWQCNDWCLKHADCKQSVFTWETKTCELFTEATAQPQLFRERWPWFNSSYCDTVDQKESMLDMLHKVYDAKPWVPPVHNCSWGADSCLHTKCCADVCDASWDFETCKYYTCYKRDENWAGCKTGGPPENWDGTELGGHPNTEVGPAEEGKLIQGTKLYCFSVIMWDLPPDEGWQDSEGELANNWKEKGLGIMQCDDYSMFDGLDGGSVHNIQSFIRAWNMVKDDGRWKRNDWSIKVDPDAVFFPDHFRKKVEWQYRTPQGATVYMRNTFYKFQFLGALEALTREALEVYFERNGECQEKLGQQGGEDYWLLQCLEGLGIDYQTDVALLHDKYAADENCGDPNGVAHHFYKKIEGGDGWENCWNTANDAWNNEHPE